MPARLADGPRKYPAPHPHQEQDDRRNAAIEVEQAPRQEQEWKRVGPQVPPRPMHQRVRKDAKHTPLLARVNSQPREVPVHARLQHLESIHHKHQEQRDDGRSHDTLHIRFHISNHFGRNTTIFSAECKKNQMISFATNHKFVLLGMLPGMKGTRTPSTPPRRAT